MITPRPHKIAPHEVRQWFGDQRTYKLKHEDYEKIADGLNGIKWADEPATPVGIIEQSEPDPWDIEGAIRAAYTLTDNFPKMLGHWEAERQKHGAIMDLQKSLQTALPYIEAPYGVTPYRQKAHGRKPAINWHIVAVMIFRSLHLATGEKSAGKFSKNSILVKVTYQALRHMGYAGTVTGGAVAAHLTRWHKRSSG
jgi:hypothetical protein